MGKTEKIVVLSVLFLVVVLFTWSLQSDGTSAQVKDGSPETAARPSADRIDTDPSRARTLERGSPLPGGPELTARGDTDASVAGAGNAGRIELAPSEPLLISEFGPRNGVDGPASTPAPSGPIRMQPGWDLVTTAGLERTLDPGTMVMHPREDATWESLARDLYGDESKAGLLRHHNEGMAQPGEEVFVPAKDEIGAAVSERVIEVLVGESLWGVASRTLGDGSRWREIFEANRDVLTDPDLVAPGTRLKIPVRR